MLDLTLTCRRRWRRKVAPLALVLLLIGLLPGHPVQALEVKDQSLDNTQDEFVSGSFFGTAVSPEVNPTVVGDKGGTVQLTPLGYLNPWTGLAGQLYTGLAGHGVATIGDRLYTVGGIVEGGTTNAVYWARIDRTTGTLTNHGLPVGDVRRLEGDTWANDPLPAAQGSTYDGCTAPDVLTKRSNAAVAAYDRGDGSGYLYVIGGTAPLTNCGNAIAPGVARDLSVPTVQIGTVTSDGEINWTSGVLSSTFLPSPPLAQDDGKTIGDLVVGIQSSQAVIVKTSAGKLFLYVLGGSGTLAVEANVNKGRTTFITPAVFYTEINPADGSLHNPDPSNTAVSGPWVRTADIPVRPPMGMSGTYGIYEHTAAVGRTISGNVVNEGIFVAGGYIFPQGANTIDANNRPRNPYVYLAIPNATTGALTWDRTPTLAGTDPDNIDPPGSLVGTEGDAVASLASLAYNNKLYLIAGSVTSDSGGGLNSIITGAYDNNFLFQPLLSEGEFFIGRQPPKPVLSTGLVETGAALMNAIAPPGTNDPNAAWSFVVGGQMPDGKLSGAIYLGKIGSTNESSPSTRVRDGWYYSDYYDISMTDNSGKASAARVLSIRWATEIDRGATGNPNADIILEFRYKSVPTLRCAADVFDDTTPWLRLDGDPSNESFFSTPATAAAPQNEVLLRQVFKNDDFKANCFQYRAHLIQNGLSASSIAAPASNPVATPKLLSVSIQKVLPGMPDLRVVETKDFSVQVPDGHFEQLYLKITNLNIDGASNTLPADALEGGQTHVLLCVSYDPQASPPDPPFPTIPVSERPACARVYAFLNRSALGVEKSVTLDRSSEWIINAEPDTTLYGDLGQLFTNPGHYKVGVVIDPLNLVDEGTTGENNNLAEFNGVPQILEFTITGPPLPAPSPTPTPTTPTPTIVPVDTGKKVFLPLVSR